MCPECEASKEAMLAELTRGISRESLADESKKSERLNIRITRAERAEIEGMCRELGLNISEYLSGLHRHAYRQWSHKRTPRRQSRKVRLAE